MWPPLHQFPWQRTMFCFGLISHVKLAQKNIYKTVKRTYSFMHENAIYLCIHHGRWKDFFQRGNSGFFQVVTKSMFWGGATTVKFHFANSKLTEKHSSTKRKSKIANFKIKGEQGLSAPLFRRPWHRLQYKRIVNSMPQRHTQSTSGTGSEFCYELVLLAGAFGFATFWFETALM